MAPPTTSLASFRPTRGRYVYRDGPLPGPADEDLEFTKALYDEKIGYLDELLSDLMDALLGLIQFRRTV